MNTFMRRLAAAALSTAVATGSALIAPPAQAATNAYASSAAGWLSRQLTGGVVHNDQFKFDDYGLSLDVYFALKALGRPAAAASVLRRMDDNPGAYIGAGNARSAGATGKLATAVILQGRAPRAFGGVNLISTLEGLVDTTHAGQIGRGVDSGPDDFSNTIGQGWVVRALAGSGSRLADEATAFLVRQQCTAGFFRQDFEPTTTTGTSFTCNGAQPAATASIDSTALAVQALVSARAHGVRGLDDEVSRAATWLVRQQRPNGAFVGNGVSNTNTTGLAAAALVATGRTVAAERAAAWVSRLQVSASDAQRSPRLRREVGAIAYNGAALAAGARRGIPVDQRDQWRRATAQAAIGVNAVRIVRVGTPRGYVHGGSRVLVRLAGLAAGERFTLRATGVRAVQGSASARGLASARLRLPRVTRPLPVRVTGSSSARVGTATLHVLGPRRFHAALRSRAVHRARVQRVTVTGMAAHEPVRLYYRGARIWTGTASVRGRAAHAFGVGRVRGPKSLRVVGAFRDRSVTTSFRVVR